MPDTSCSWPVCSFSCFIIIICVAELDQCWRGPREKEDNGNSACALLSLYAYTYAPFNVYRVNNKTFCYYVLPKRRTFSVCFLFCFVWSFVCLFAFLINEANWWTWDSQIRCLEIPSMTQPRPHCAFPWLLDKLRWTQAMVTAVSHFLVQNRVRILRTEQQTPTKNFQEYPPGRPEAW